MDGTEYQGSLPVLRKEKSFTSKTSSKNKLRRSNHLPIRLEVNQKAKSAHSLFCVYIKNPELPLSASGRGDHKQPGH